MSHHTTPELKDNLTLGSLGGRLLAIGGALGVLGLGGAAALGAQEGDSYKRFLFAYLVSFAFFLSISLGGLFFVTIQHLTRAGWSVTVRRMAELLAANLTLVALLALVIVVPMLMGNSSLYEWANHAHVEADHLLHKKAAYLNVPFFALRCAFYFGVWALLSRFFLGNSSKQDVSGDPKLTSRMETFAAPSVLLFGLTLTFAAFDFLMSIEPRWFSTIFGVYFFAGCAMSMFATLILFGMFLQKTGRVATAITTEHYHDLGKFLFAFVFFWGYIAFSQFMLIWYANVPEETEWYQHRIYGAWMGPAIVLVAGHFVVPFLGLLSRHIKRNRLFLGLWATFMLAMHYLDLYWLVLPAYNGEEVPFALIDVLCFIGLAGFYVAGLAWLAKGRNLVPVKDPRLGEALRFENI